MAINKKRRSKSRFIAVDIWQKEFSQISVRAIFDVYEKSFNADQDQMKKVSFSHCVNSLRRLEKPNYENPRDSRTS